MNKMKRAAMEMASLSIYKGILNRTVPKGLLSAFMVRRQVGTGIFKCMGQLFCRSLRAGLQRKFGGVHYLHRAVR